MTKTSRIFLSVLLVLSLLVSGIGGRLPKASAAGAERTEWQKRESSSRGLDKIFSEGSLNTWGLEEGSMCGKLASGRSNPSICLNPKGEGP